MRSVAKRPLDDLKDLEICGCLGLVENFLEVAAEKPEARTGAEQPAPADDHPSGPGPDAPAPLERTP